MFACDLRGHGTTFTPHDRHKEAKAVVRVVGIADFEVLLVLSVTTPARAVTAKVKVCGELGVSIPQRKKITSDR